MVALKRSLVSGFPRAATRFHSAGHCTLPDNPVILGFLPQERGIKVPEAEEEAAEALERLTPTHPALQSHRVHLSDDGADLVWPAVFLYPETMESDFVQQFDERSTFGEQTDVLFGDPGNQPEWNADGRYAPGKVTVRATSVLYCLCKCEKV